MTRYLRRLLLLGLLIISLIIRNPLLLLLNALLLVVIGSSWLWWRYCLAGVNYARRFGALRLFCGESTDLWIEVVNAKPLPLAWLKTEDEFPRDITFQNLQLDYSGKAERKMLVNLFTLRWYERVRRHYQLHADQRGVFDFGPVRVSSGDLFGFRERKRDDDRRETLCVYPKTVALTRLGLQAARPLGDYRAERRIVEDPLRLATLRDYQPGDSVRHIHWKATAHRGALQTKVFDPSASQNLIICLNTQTLGTPYAGVMTEVFETAVVVAASLARAGLDARQSVGLIANSGARESHRWIRLTASRRSDQLPQILEALAALTYLTMMPLERLLQIEAPRLPYGATVVVVSPIVDEPILSEMLDLRAAGHPIALIVVNPSNKQLATPLPVPTYYVTQNWRDLESIEIGE